MNSTIQQTASQLPEEIIKKNMRSPRSQAETISRIESISYLEETLPELCKIDAPLLQMVKSEKFQWGPVENLS